MEGLTAAVTEPTDSLGRAADPYREPYDPSPYHPGDAGTAGATDLLDFPPMPPYPDAPYPDAVYTDTAYPDTAYPDTAFPGTPYPDTAYPGAGTSYGASPVVPQPSPEPAPRTEPPATPGGLRLASEAEATARLRIKLPAAPPQPSTTLRPHAAWEDTDDGAVPEGAPRPKRSGPETTPFRQVAASPARPSALPAELAALTTATLVVPLPRDTRPTPALLTTTLPPNSAAQANAALLEEAFHDTLEQVFGVDLANASAADVGIRRSARPGSGRRSADADTDADAGDVLGDWFREESGAVADGRADAAFVFSESRIDSMDQAPYEAVPYEYVPGTVAAAAFGGPYGVPTHPAPYPGVAQDPSAHDPFRHALALRYLGGIFHDSTGEASYLDPDAIRGRVTELEAAATAPGPADTDLTRTAVLEAASDAPTERLLRIPAPTKPGDPPPRSRASRAGAGKSGLGRSGAGRSGTGRSGAGRSGAGRSGTGRSGGTRAGGTRAAGTRTGGRSESAHAKPAASRPVRAIGGKVLTGLVVLAGAFAIVYGLALVLAGGVFGGTVPRGTVVDGVPIGGMSRAAAEQTLDSALGSRAHAPLRLSLGTVQATLDPARSGLSLDAAQTVATATAGRTNPFAILPALFGGHRSVAPVTVVDSAALTRQLTTIADAYDSPMTEGRIFFRGTVPVVTAPKEGRGFSLDGAAAAVRSAYLRLDGPIAIPVQTLRPMASPASLQDALRDIARPAVSAPISLVTGTTTEQLTPQQIGAAVVIAPDASGRMVAQVDGAALRGDLPAAALAQETAPVNASFTIPDGSTTDGTASNNTASNNTASNNTSSNGAPTLVPGRDGSGFSPDVLSRAVLAVLTRPAPRTATVAPGDLPPAFTTADAQALDVTDVLGTSTIAVASAPNRSANVQRAAALVGGSVIGPGETWSFLKTLGPLDTAHGFALSAAAQKAGVDPSGGVDTVATAVFDAAFSSGMGDTLHHPHATYIDRYPVGLDAAVVAPGTDLQWTNTGNHPVYLYASYANGSLTVALLGERMYDQVTVTVSQRYATVQSRSGSSGDGSDSACTGSSGTQPGFQVDVSRTLTRGGSQAGGEQFHVQYAPQGGAGCASGSSGGSPSGGAGSSAGSGASGSGSSGGGDPSSPDQPNPSPSSTGLLGGLLH